MVQPLKPRFKGSLDGQYNSMTSDEWLQIDLNEERLCKEFGWTLFDGTVRKYKKRKFDILSCCLE